MNQFNQAVNIEEPMIRESVSDVGIELRLYWNIIWREKLGIIGLAAAVSVMAIVVVSNITPVYQATGSLLIESKKTNVVSIEEVYGIDSSQREYFATQFEILHSRELAETVIQKLNIPKHAEYDVDKNQPFLNWRLIPFLDDPEPLSEEAKWQFVIGAFQNNLKIEPIDYTQLVKISFESIDPALTHKVVNGLGNAYINV